MKTDTVILGAYQDISNFQSKTSSSTAMFQGILKYAKIFIVFGTLMIEEEIIQWIKIILHGLWSIFFIVNLTLSTTELHLWYTY